MAESGLIQCPGKPLKFKRRTGSFGIIGTIHPDFQEAHRRKDLSGRS